MNLPTANELACAPGSLVIVRRLNRDQEKDKCSANFEEFQDIVTEIEISATNSKWDARYYFLDHDDDAKHFEIIQVLATVKLYNPMPRPKYPIGSVLEYQHHWDKTGSVMVDKISSYSLIWDRNVQHTHTRYLPVRPGDYIHEDDIIAHYTFGGLHDKGDKPSPA